MDTAETLERVHSKKKKSARHHQNHFPAEDTAYNNNNAGFVEPSTNLTTSPYFKSLAKPLKSPFHENLNVLETWTDEAGTVVTVEEYAIRRGIGQHWTEAYHRGIAGHCVKRVHIKQNGTHVRVESSRVMHFMKGELSFDYNVPYTAAGRHPKLKGTGHVWFIPSYHYHIKFDLSGEVVLEHGTFLCCQGTIEVKSKVISGKASVMGDSTPVQTKLVGTGWVVLRIPVPECEVQIVKLENEVLKVGHHHTVLLRTNSIDFSAEYAGKGIGTSSHVLRTYKGTGLVWLMPTVVTYGDLLTPGGV